MAEEKRFQQARENFRRRLQEEQTRGRRAILLTNDPHTPPVTNRLFRSMIRPNVGINHTISLPTSNTGHYQSNSTSNASQHEPSVFPSCSSWRMPSIAIVSPMRQNNTRLSLSSRNSTIGDDDITESSSNISAPEEDINTVQRSPYIPTVEDISSGSDESHRLVRQLFEDIDDVGYLQHQNYLPINPPYCADVDSDGEPTQTEPCNLPLSQQYDPDREVSFEDRLSRSPQPILLSSASTSPSTSRPQPEEYQENPPKRYFISVDKVEQRKNVLGNLTMVEGMIRYTYLIKRTPQEEISEQPNQPMTQEETYESPKRKVRTPTQISIDEHRAITPTMPGSFKGTLSLTNSSPGMSFGFSSPSDPFMCPPTPRIP